MQQITAERLPQADVNEVVLNGWHLPVVGQVSIQDLARFPTKVTFGDYSQDSDPLLSTYVISSLTGGIGNEKLKEGVDDETYWTGTLETRYPGQITLGSYTRTLPSPVAGAGIARPLGDFPSAAPSFWACFGSTVCRWDEVDGVFIEVGTLPSPPVGKPVEYDDSFYIPLGTDGYARLFFDGATTTITTATDFEARCFTLWDNKIAMLTMDGRLTFRFGSAPWEATTDSATLPSAAVGRNLVVFINQRGDSTIHVITNTDVWAYDRENLLLYRTQLQFPPHPDNGLASTNWRGESLYVSVGLGIHAYNGGIVSAMGPDGRYGLPPDLRGTITDLTGEYNALIAVVRGAIRQDTAPRQVELVPPLYQDPLPPYKGINAVSCVLRWTQFGWHPVWQSETPDGFPTWAIVSRADNAYRLWWGYGDDMLYQNLPYTFYNPKQGMRVGESEFAPSGTLITGWFDADMVAFDKLASHCEMVLEDPFGDGRSTGRVMISFQADDDPSWRHLGEQDLPGRGVFWFNTYTDAYGDLFSAGQAFNRIRFRFDMESDDITVSPVMQSFQLKFKKTPLSQLSFRFTINLGLEAYKGKGPEEIANFVRLLTSANAFAQLVHRDKSYRVTIAQTQGSEFTGYDHRSGMTVNAVEVLAPLSRLAGVS